jgi:hypothetical protein
MRLIVTILSFETAVVSEPIFFPRLFMKSIFILLIIVRIQAENLPQQFALR